MTIHQLRQARPTDHPILAPLRVATNATEARIAAAGSVTSHCGDCTQSWTGHTIPDHKCVNAAGRDLTPMKAARAEGARRELRAVKNLAGNPACVFCGHQPPAPGQVHTCTADREPMPHDLAAAQFVRRGTTALLSHELSEIQKGTR